MSAGVTVHVPFLDLGALHDTLREPLSDALDRVTKSGWYVMGPELEAFEREFADFVGARHCVGVGNGLEALTVGLAALDVGRGDEVIVPSNTFIATWLAVSHAGATIVPVEPDPTTYNLSAEGIARALTPRTKAIIPVHLYGQPCPIDEIEALARGAGVALLDDAAQAHGSRWRERRIGSFGDATTWSFYPGKNLGALGDGGAITTDDDDLASRAKLLRNYGSSERYHHQIVGWNSRLDPMQAAALRVKLPYLDRWNQQRREQAAIYHEQLADLASLTLPSCDERATHVWHLYTVRVKEREVFRNRLADRGVQTLIHYPIAPHLQPAYAHLGFERGDFPIAEAIHDQIVSLPIGPHLGLEQIAYVCRVIRDL